MPSIKKARAAGVMVIALDTPTDPQDATDALFATDNFKAGVLIGKYAKAALNGKPAKIATLDLAPGVSVGVLRHNGFLEGFGVKRRRPVDLGSGRLQPGHARRSGEGPDGDGKLPAEDAATSTSSTRSTSRPRRARTRALKAAGKDKGVMIVSVDGGCEGVRNVKAGAIAATSQQYPLKMASLGVDGGRRLREDRQEGRPATPTPASR